MYRASIDSENMNKDEIAENFRDITASIQKLRLDSSADLGEMLAMKVTTNYTFSKTTSTHYLKIKKVSDLNANTNQVCC